ncbi:hypothetical protein LHJ74_17920 [Streptomyces sp. N2-109]|uniref:Uncharacterized protein n=1 Tax=Streptomyces gossypii TaxID=2883101 RepID=A0ABT2JV92_9ACTN|nr:hypothetical protein [Streptomyces gossypii]MCT2591751.1 hypothetical protein [Streptomyces gossypii]
MICPHCAKSLLRKERTGRICTHCKGKFALEPKENSLRLHDVRMRELADKLSDGKRLAYTPPQLWYAALRNRVPPPEEGYGGCSCLLFVGLAIALFVLGYNDLIEDQEIVFAALFALLAVLLVGLVEFLLRRRAQRDGAHKLPMSLETFRTSVLPGWSTVYGAPPPGLVDEGHVRSPAPERPRIALACPDRGVLACLAANGVPEAYSMVLAETVQQIPPGVPVIVLHDAAPAGLAFADGVRIACGERAVPAGLLPRVAIAHKSAFRLRTKPLAQSQRDWLRATFPALTKEEHAWLAQGWWSPLAAVRPAQLLHAVTRAAERAEAQSDPELHQARASGFLTWPTA